MSRIPGRFRKDKRNSSAGTFSSLIFLVIHSSKTGTHTLQYEHVRISCTDRSNEFNLNRINYRRVSTLRFVVDRATCTCFENYTSAFQREKLENNIMYNLIKRNFKSIHASSYENNIVYIYLSIFIFFAHL